MNNVAVIMSVYRNDNPDFLRDAILSILSQTLECDFYICIDGPIPMELEKVIEDFMKKDEIIILRNTENIGLASSLNFIINYILNKGFDYKYIARMDADDISRPNRLFQQIRFLESNPSISILGSWCREFGSKFSLEKKEVPISHDEIKLYALTRCPMIHPTVVFRFDVFKAGYRYPEKTFLSEDMAFWFNLIDAKYLFSNLPEILLDYRISDKTLLRRLGFRKAASEVKIRISYCLKAGVFSPFVYLKILSRMFFNILPLPIIRIIYANFR
jgi:hypothetical protein